MIELKCPECGSTELSAEEEVVMRFRWSYLEDGDLLFAEPEAITESTDKRCDKIWIDCEGCGALLNTDDFPELEDYPQTETSIRSVEELNGFLQAG